MNPETHSRDSGTRAGIFLREDRFDLVMRILGCRSDTAAARMLDVDPKTIYLSRARGVNSEKFIAATLAAMKEHEAALAELGISPEFEAVFEVREKKAAA